MVVEAFEESISDEAVDSWLRGSVGRSAMILLIDEHSSELEELIRVS